MNMANIFSKSVDDHKLEKGRFQSYKKWKLD